MFDETGDVEKSQGWTALVLDTNGNGKRDEYTEPNQPLDPNKDRRIAQGFYAVMPSPVDSSVWGTIRTTPGAVVRIVPGNNPPETRSRKSTTCRCRASARAAATSTARAWCGSRSAAATSAASTARKCKGPLNGPKATGDHCPEGWAFYQYPGPGFEGIGDNSAESSYYAWVDQHDTFGLGKDVPISTANLQDGFVALDRTARWCCCACPIRSASMPRGFDGRIDDPNAGWKGRGLWASSGDRTPWLIEGGKGMKPMAVHIQLRPDPLAK